MRVVLAAVSALLISSLVGCSATDDDPPNSTEPTHAQGRAPSQDDLVGSWRPVRLFHEAEKRTMMNGDPLDLRFADQPEGFGWRAYDGCNWTGAFIEIGENGDISLLDDPATTMRGCVGPEGRARSRNVEAVTEARRMELRGKMLVFLNADNEVIGEYARA